MLPATVCSSQESQAPDPRCLHTAAAAAAAVGVAVFELWMSQEDVKHKARMFDHLQRGVESLQLGKPV